MSLIWENLSFTGDSVILRALRTCGGPCRKHLGSEQEILKGLNGSIKRGELTALMGPSGAGKSTLLKCLIGGNSLPGCNGKIFLSEFGDGQHLRACFLTQDEQEHLLQNLTVKESLISASQIKNAGKRGVDHEARVQQLLRQLDMESVTNNKVSKCSGGQKKRLAIGLELTSTLKLNVIFLDEPTSGLDSFAGEQVVQLLSKMAKEQNMTIVATIHQPSYKILSLFDTVYILSKTGKFVYCGSPTSLSAHIHQFGVKCSDIENPADVIIEIASSVSRSAPDSSEIREMEEANVEPLNPFKDVCLKMTEAYLHGSSASLLTAPRYNWKPIHEHGLCKNGAGFGFWNLWYLTRRTAIGSLFRQKLFLLIRLSLHAIVAVALIGLYNTDTGREDGCILSNVGMDPSLDPHDCTCTVQEIRMDSDTTLNIKFHFFSLLFLMFTALMPTVLTFPAEIKIFMNEHRNGWYSTGSYYISKTLVELLVQLPFPIFYTWFLYWYSGQIGMDHWYSGFFGFMSTRYSQFLSITLLSCYIAQGLGFLIGILCVHSFDSSIIVSSSTLLFLFLFSGFFVKTVQLPSRTKWLTDFSYIRFSFESLLLTLYGFERCDSHATLPLQSSVLYSFDLHEADLLGNVFCMLGHLVVFRLLAFFVLKYRGDPNFLKPGKMLRGTGRGIQNFFRFFSRLGNWFMTKFTCVSSSSSYQKQKDDVEIVNEFETRELQTFL